MHVGIDVKYMHTIFGGRDLSSFGDIATSKTANFPFMTMDSAETQPVKICWKKGILFARPCPQSLQWPLLWYYIFLQSSRFKHGTALEICTIVDKWILSLIVDIVFPHCGVI